MAKKEEKSVTPEGTVIARCTCKHAGQDELHGPGMRVKNIGRSGPRCTVCEPGPQTRKARKGAK